MTSLHDRLWASHPAVKTGDNRPPSERYADKMKQGLANFKALFGVLVAIAGWMILNSHISGHHHAFDPYPWILLNLCLSCFAALQCFILLIANKRAEQIAAELAQHTYENTQKLSQLLAENTALTEAVHTLAQDLHDHIMNS